MPRSLEFYLNQAVRLLQEDRPVEAIRILDGAVEQFSRDLRAWQLRGTVHHRMGNTPTAAADLEQARALGCIDHCAMLALIDCHRRNGDVFSAKQIAEEMAEDPDLPVSILAPLACSLGLLAEFSTALVLCETIVQRKPEMAAAHFGIAYYRSRLEFTARQILPFVLNSHQLEPTNPVYTANAGLLLRECGNAERGWATLDAINTESIQCPSLVTTIYEKYRQAGRHETARRWRIRRHQIRQMTQQGASPRWHCCVTLPMRMSTTDGTVKPSDEHANS